MIAKLLILTLAQNACPNLAGQYWCLLSPEKLDVLTVEQWANSDDASITNYRFSYRSIGDSGEVTQANSSGVADRYGWTTRCETDRLVSISNNGDFRADTYLEKDHLMSEVNHAVTQDCSRKN